MIHPDASLIMQIQIALIGIILVVGLFFIWRFLQKIYDSILSNKQCNCNKINNNIDTDDIEDDNIAEELMNQVFNNNSNDAEKSYMMFKIPTMLSPETDKSSVTIEEIKSIPEFKIEQIQYQNSSILVKEIEEDTEEEKVQHDEDLEEDVDTESVSINPLSESKLKKMNLTDLKKLCEERHLSSEGIKKELIDRILGISR